MPASEPITVAIAHFEDLLGRGLRGLIETDPSLIVVASDVAHARIPVVLRAHRPSVAILDVDALDRLAEVRELSAQHPATRLVLVAGNPTPAECAQLLAFGASACLGRDTQARDVLNAIHLASRGLQLIPRAIQDLSAARPGASHLLTQREADVLPLLTQGRSNAQIAAALHIGVETVRTHARSIYRKLGVSSRRDLTALPPQAPNEVSARTPAARHRLAFRERRPGLPHT